MTCSAIRWPAIGVELFLITLNGTLYTNFRHGVGFHLHLALVRYRHADGRIFGTRRRCFSMPRRGTGRRN